MKHPRGSEPPRARRGWRQKLSWFAAEIVIVVAGVLIALAVNEWWQGRSDRRAEVRYLQLLREDVQASLERLDESSRQLDRLEFSLGRILEGDLRTAPTDSVARWIYDGLFWIALYQPRLAAVKEMEASGHIRLLPPALRRQIAELRAVLDIAAMTQADYIRSQQSRVDPILIADLPLAALLAGADNLPISELLPARPDWSPLRAPAVRNAMAFKLSMSRIVELNYARLRTAFEQILALCERRLAELGHAAAPAQGA